LQNTDPVLMNVGPFIIQIHAKFRAENITGRNYVWERAANGKIILKWILKKNDMGLWNEFNLFRIGASGGLL